MLSQRWPIFVVDFPNCNYKTMNLQPKPSPKKKPAKKKKKGGKKKAKVEPTATDPPKEEVFCIN